MKVVNMHEAKTHLSRLVAAAARGEPFAIARAGRPLVRVTAIEAVAPRRLGFLAPARVPADFDRLAEAEIAADFDGA